MCVSWIRLRDFFSKFYNKKTGDAWELYSPSDAQCDVCWLSSFSHLNPPLLWVHFNYHHTKHFMLSEAVLQSLYPLLNGGTPLLFFHAQLVWKGPVIVLIIALGPFHWAQSGKLWRERWKDMHQTCLSGITPGMLQSRLNHSATRTPHQSSLSPWTWTYGVIHISAQ